MIGSEEIQRTVLTKPLAYKSATADTPYSVTDSDICPLTIAGEVTGNLRAEAFLMGVFCVAHRCKRKL